MSYAVVADISSNANTNKLHLQDEAIHSWYRFVLSFPPHLVRHYLDQFSIGTGRCVLDPFCGTGTTLVEAKRQGIHSVGVEGTPMGAFATTVKLDWEPDPVGLVAHASRVAQLVNARLSHDREEGYLDLSPECRKTLLKNSISPLPLHKAIVLRQCLEELKEVPYYRHELLALAKALPTRIGNLRFGPEVGVGAIKTDAPVLEVWLEEVRATAADLASAPRREKVSSTCRKGDSRDLSTIVAPNSVDAVITSPPYPNEKDYTRIMRLEMAVLGFVHSPRDLQDMKRRLLCSNTRTAYKDNNDDYYVAGHSEVQRIAEEIEARRVSMGKTSGFERVYPRAVRLYFGGMHRHLANLRSALRPGARLAYVVGDQASYLQVMIRTGALLADIAESLGYEVVGTDLFRTRLATATKEQLREEALLLRWPG